MNQGQSARSDALEALIQYDQSTTSMKTLLREMQTASPDSPDSQFHTQSLSLSVVRFRNTIDFILSRSLGKRKLHDLRPRDLNILRLAVYEVHWLNADLVETSSFYPKIESHYSTEFKEAESVNLDAVIEGMPIVNRLSLKHSHPTFLVKTLLDNLTLDETGQLLTANNQKRTYYIRPNMLYDDYNSVLESLVEVKMKRDPDIPEVFKIVEGVDSVVRSQLFKDGRVLIQDKASIITVNALNPEPGQKIWDACAAPGMKTQLIAERMKDQGQIIASDVYEERVKTGRERSQHLNASQIEWLHADATKPVVHDADKILIDAPCTSTGILQAYPSFKWRLNKETLFALMTVQNKILDAILTDYADKPGTEIVFSTCSILPHEGESQIDSAMQRHNFELLKPLDYGSSGYPGFDCSKKVQRLFPHKHDTSGFFIARLKIRH
ncbi:MAG: class I SAM-dependent methyltransferase [Candidatus Thorarchaeota archaeon]|nr:class I SAM-dependent methyltransferase [Candidatus Thorarchaeota archaeon]